MMLLGWKVLETSADLALGLESELHAELGR